MRSRETHQVHTFAAASFVLSFVVRLWWVFRVQSPFQAIYSDMNGYVERALMVLHGTSTSFPRLTALYPYGAHYFYAAAFGVLGFEHRPSIDVMQALVTTVPTYFYVLFAARFFTRPWPTLLLGIVFAVWQPIVWCTGFFLSEIPYLGLLYVNTWQCLRFVETKGKRAALGVGITGALLFSIRPQFILTFALLGAAYLWSARRFPARRSFGKFARVLVPWAIVLAFSIGRYHHLTGSWGLISENGQLNRLFADTEVGRVEGRWRAANGDAWFFAVEPPAKTPMHERGIVSIKGYMGDATLLAEAKREQLVGKTWSWRIYRAFDNIRLLWDKNDPWPEAGRALTGSRAWMQLWFNELFRWLFLPLAIAGVIVLRKNAAYVITLAHLLTLVGLSMLFLAEARYRVPYDPLMILFAFAAIRHFVVRFKRRPV